MKKIMKTLSLLLAVGAMAFGSGLHHEDTKVASAADGDIAVTWDFTAKTAKHGAYTDNWTYGNVSIFGAANNNGDWAYIRVGGKSSNTNKTATLTTKTIVTVPIKEINLSASTVSSRTSFKMNTITLTVSANKDMSNPFYTDSSVSISKSMKWVKDDGTSWPANSYYRLSCAWSNTSDKNGGMDVTKVLFTEGSAVNEEISDQEKIAAVEDAIVAIGTVANTAASKKLIDDARSAYDALDAELKTNVSNYQDLLDAEATYNLLVNQAAADAVITLLENLPEANEITDYSSASEVEAARNAYDELTKDQMDLVPDQLVDKLEEVEAKLEQFAPAIETATITFDSTSKRTEYNSSKQVWTENGITVTNNKASSETNVGDYSNPARFYKNSQLVIEYAKEMIKIEFTTPGGEHLTALKDSITSGATVTASGTVVTAELDVPSTSFTISLSAGQARANSITIYYASSGENETPVYPTDFELSASEITLIVGESSSVTVTEYIGDGITETNVSWSTEDTDIIDLNTTNGNFTALVVGTATITVSVQTGDETYLSKTCVVTVNPKPASRYNATLITDAATIKAGDKIVIAAADESVALGETQDGNNRKHVEVEKNDNKFGFVSGVEIITIESGLTDGTYALKTDEGYLYAASSRSNHLKSQEKLDANGSFTIEIAEGIATIKATGTNTRNWIRYNSSDDLFSCYGSGQKDISIYKVEADYNLFVTDLLATKPCLKDAEVALELQERFECLSEEDKATFLGATVSETDSTLLSERLDYIKTMANVVSNTKGLSSNLLSNITSSNNILIILVVGLLGLTSILGYYFLNKKKYAK